MTITSFVTLDRYLTSEFHHVMYEGNDNSIVMTLTWDSVGNKIIVVADT